MGFKFKRHELQLIIQQLLAGVFDRGAMAANL